MLCILFPPIADTHATEPPRWKLSGKFREASMNFKRTQLRPACSKVFRNYAVTALAKFILFDKKMTDRLSALSFKIKCNRVGNLQFII